MSECTAHGNRLRSRFRLYALDGAHLYFHPATGTNVRIATAATRTSKRTAPRVAMFGITNDCNRTCAHCSRDRSRRSAWTVQTAADVLEGLARAGTLEVAFGGGEPFAFDGFRELVTEIHEATPLAIHVTTNGTLLDERSWAPFVGRFGEVRVSIYDDRCWRLCARLFRATHQQWGANLLVDDASLTGLPARLAELTAAGCHDVSLLSYVGAPERPLSWCGRAELARIVEQAPLQCRLSVCAGESIPVRRLMDGFDNDGDCGAGSDFVSIAPDRRVQSCSYRDESAPAETAEQVLRTWRERRAAWRQPTPRSGCARSRPARGAPEALPPVAIWQSFSGNNSGECIMVAKFETVQDAEGYLAELLPGWASSPGPAGAGTATTAGDGSSSDYSSEWKELFQREQVAGPALLEPNCECERPDDLVAIGSSVFAWGYGCSDIFPELRALAWKRGAFVLPDGIHLHAHPSLLVALRGRSREDVTWLVDRVPFPAARIYPHGEVLLVTLPLNEAAVSLEETKSKLLAWTENRRVAAEMFDGDIGVADMIAAKQRLGDARATRPRLWMTFFGWNREASREQASRFARTLQGESMVRTDSALLVDPARGRKRLAVLGYRRGATVYGLEGEVVEVSASYWVCPPPRTKGKKAPERVLDMAALERALRATLPHVEHFELVPNSDWRRSIRVRIHTSEPGAVLGVLEAAAQVVQAEHYLHVRDLDPLGGALSRLMTDLRSPPPSS